MQVTTKRLTIEPISSSISIVWFQLTVFEISGVCTILFVVRVIVPEVVLNLIATET
jgi:hypothetical protein